MKKASKRKTGVYAYLNSTKVLETGSEQAIQDARKTYWKGYKSAWRKDQRTKMKAFTIVCTSTEAEKLAEYAKMHKRSPSQFIKESCLHGYMRKRYVVPDTEALSAIRQLLAFNCNALHNLFDENLLPFDVGRQVMKRMEELEQKVLAELYDPKEHKNG